MVPSCVILTHMPRGTRCGILATFTYLIFFANLRNELEVDRFLKIRIRVSGFILPVCGMRNCKLENDSNIPVPKS